MSAAAALALPAAASRVCLDCAAPLTEPYARWCSRCRPQHRKRQLLYAPSAQIDAEITAAYKKFREYNNRKAITLAARRIGWPRHAVVKRARAIGLARTKEAPWSEREVSLLQQYGYLSDAKLSEKLRAHGFVRSATAVHLKVKRMRIKGNGDWYSATKLANAFGCDIHVVRRWILSKALPAEKRGTERGEAQGGDTWLIRHEDVQRFALAYPDEYDLAKVEKYWFLDLITGGKICR